jgi:hypothetical protein
MKSFDILLLLIITYIIYILKTKYDITNSINKITGFSNLTLKQPNGIKKKVTASTNATNTDNTDNTYIDELINEIDEWERLNGNSQIVKKHRINSNFRDIQFHDSYRDVLTAINNLVPSQKQLFNLANQPVNYSEMNPSEVHGMVTDLVDSLNKNIIAQVSPQRNNNSGWDEAIPDPNQVSGWEKMRLNLGLAPSLYPKPAPPGKVILLKIDKVQRYEIEDEIKYSCVVILQKKGIDDQMILKASLVQDKRSMHDEENFFKTHDIVMRVAIEEMFIVGFLSELGTDANKQFDMVKNNHYNLEDMEYNNLTDPKYILNELNKRHKKKSRELGYRNSLLDSEGTDFHKSLPHAYDYSSYQATRTIYDDFTTPKQFN